MCIVLKHRPGQYVIHGTLLAEVRGAEAGGPPPDAEACGDIERVCRGALILGSQRTPEQDLEYSIHQLVEVAVRALSPGINDPFTAINCIDALGTGISLIAGRELPPGLRRDAGGVARVSVPVFTFEGVADAAFHQIRQHGERSVAVLIRLLEIIAGVGPRLRTEEQRRVLRRHAELIHAQAQLHGSGRLESDLADIRTRYAEAAAGLVGGG